MDRRRDQRALCRRLGALVITMAALLPLAAPDAASAAPRTGAVRFEGNEAPAAPAGARGMSAGANHTCAIVVGNALDCWGLNDMGQLGVAGYTTIGASTASMGFNLPPVNLGTGRTATAVSAGDQHTCALLDNATVKCWGAGAAGRLGSGSTANIGTGALDMAALLPVSLGAGRTATAISAGQAHTCAILDNASVKCWGSGSLLGIGTTTNRGDNGGEMGDSLPAVDLGTGRTAVAISAGSSHTCALLDNATVKCWGSNTLGQLGLGDVDTRGDAAGEMGNSLPAVDLGPGRTATAISAGQSHTCALLDNGGVKCWGGNFAGQLGLGDVNNRGDGPSEMGASLPPVDLGSGRTATSISVGYGFTCALLDNARVKCWGGGSNGKLGTGDTPNRGDGPGEMGDNLAPLPLGTGRTATSVTTGGNHACATLDNGARKCWGVNTWGQLGQGDALSRGDNPGEMGDSLFEIRLPPVGLFEGALTDAASHADITGVDVVALRTSDFGIAGRTTSTTGSLSYRVEVPPGSYYLYLVDAAGRHVSGFAGPPTTFTISDGGFAINDLTMTPTRGGFSGQVTDQTTNTPIAGAWAYAIGPSGLAGRAVTDSSGNYTIADLTPGTYRVTVLDAPGGFRAQEYYGGTHTYEGATPFNVGAGATTPNINVALAVT